MIGGSGGGDGEDSIDGDRLRSLSTTLVRIVSLSGNGLGDLSLSRSTVLVVVRTLSTLGSRYLSLVSLSTTRVLLYLSPPRFVSSDPDLSRTSTRVLDILSRSGLGLLSLSTILVLVVTLSTDAGLGLLSLSTILVLVVTRSTGAGLGLRSLSTTRSLVRTLSIDGLLSLLTGLVNVSTSRARSTSGCCSTGAYSLLRNSGWRSRSTRVYSISSRSRARTGGARTRSTLSTRSTRCCPPGRGGSP